MKRYPRIVFVLGLLVILFITYDLNRHSDVNYSTGHLGISRLFYSYRNVHTRNGVRFNADYRYTQYDLDLEKDVIVFVHIQKTGGTAFNEELTSNLRVDPPCRCDRKRRNLHGPPECTCFSAGGKMWLFSWFTHNWVPGVHPDFTELTAPRVDAVMDNKFEHGHRKRNFHYITILRRPVCRYISEWLHVQRGATWSDAELICNGRKATRKEVPFCYETFDWRGVTLDEFLNCPYNLARNRQTRMLANLSLVNCYNHSSIPEHRYDEILLESAKQNVKNMSFIALMEYQNYTKPLFEDTFKMRFNHDLEQRLDERCVKALNNITAEQLEKIKEINNLDIELYRFAKDIFFQRLYALGMKVDVLDLVKLKEIYEHSKNH